MAFPPTLESHVLFRSVADARGAALVRPIAWLPGMRVATAPDPGFVGRLRAHGALAVYSPDLLGARALLTRWRFAEPRAGAERLSPAL